MYTTQVPRVTVDFHGSLDLQNTRFDSIISQPGLANKLVNNGETQFIYFSEDNDLNINAGSEDVSQPIQFNIGDALPAQFDASGT